MIFSRDRGSGRHTKEPRRSAAGADPSTGRGAKRARAADAAAVDETTEAELAASESGEAESTEAELTDAAGPYDISEAPEGVERLDLGSLHIPVVDGVSVRVQANNEGVIQQVALMHDDSALMLSVLAAPRGESIWDEARAEIRKELSAGGSPVEDIGNGEYGPELRARVNTPEGAVELRFVGVDGPRWLVRAIFQGPAAIDPEASPLLLDSLRELVVDRGREAMPVMDALPLRLPREIAEQATAQAAAAEANKPATNGVVPGQG